MVAGVIDGLRRRFVFLFFFFLGTVFAVQPATVGGPDGGGDAAAAATEVKKETARNSKRSQRYWSGALMVHTRLWGVDWCFHVDLGEPS